ncbi:hypothetical protein VT84_22860 [Gemmata sp. SH-PL17]|uniref:DUF2330 domain-containing protein n=1 Tax=Gemmata sp. SH-PL17 TaxID=1630693 RepID=UPI00078EED45|nr:DUF2330 domain-containing protein [Gemmata sp. SH-PL17]AMV27261.1 hypothetical protein VT84_22860 [Gemmata sp. SH-PL17]
MWTCVRLVVPALFVGVFAFPTPSEGCAVIPPRGVVVEVATESAIIIWDEKAKTQHFIRRATFAATAPGEAPVKDFGFLVPTPSVPVLEEVDDRAFDELAKITAPKIETRSPPSGGGCAMGCGMASAPKAAVGHADVELLAEKHVAGYDAKVMKAGDSDALAAWLNERGYEVRPALARWLKPYLDKGWVVTAFKIAGASSTGASTAVGSAAVRMSFTTEAPFFPYSEPDDMREAKTRRLFRVYAIANQKMAGVLGTKELWAGNTVWAGKPGANGWKGVGTHLKIPGWAPNEGTWLTEFEDGSSPRKGGSDLTFIPAADQTSVERPTRIVYAARTDTGAAPAFAVLAGAAMCLFVSRFLVALVNRRE